ncbi:hypothetical protein F4824DRAFT_504749 [Ustulina deusta]|nr:hypothetical protein F4824DRAFT_504749 [Ustulina deusta]
MQSRLGTGLAATWGLLYLVPWAVKLPGNARHPPLPPSPSQPACSASLSLKVKLHRATPRTKTNALPSVFLHASPSLCSRTCEARPSPVFVQRAQRCRFSTILTLIRRPSRSVLARRLAVCSVLPKLPPAPPGPGYHFTLFTSSPRDIFALSKKNEQASTDMTWKRQTVRDHFLIDFIWVSTPACKTIRPSNSPHGSGTSPRIFLSYNDFLRNTQSSIEECRPKKEVDSQIHSLYRYSIFP